ncbi:AtpZ/AtpI family protein [Paenibacillus sp. L3-i20]|uniref:AtpZ/AtpI family protein n=1 Tax=Paenibacillus sp. L3-i20 TaxID=2905833 RepID=UPI001EDFAE88|nr:AtpZ/AtpI family protein [Paenibacillus sp. L3-i20]GKU76951.1 hypothetical protein L3i20_v213480 [Paenibacillus sp. L3-i20]
MNKRSKRNNPWIAAGLVGMIGIDIAFCIFLGYWIGTVLDSRSGSGNNWTIGGVLVGLTIGLVSAILIVKKVLEDSDG